MVVDKIFIQIYLNSVLIYLYSFMKIAIIAAGVD
jgi:hypothetical protein